MIGAVRTWFEAHALDCRAPVLEIGSYNVNGSVRDLFPEPYTGLDLQAGPSVDVVGNAEWSNCFAEGSFQTIVSTETLEHVQRPWEVVENIGYWLAPGGVALVSVPFMFAIHDYPVDYWRISDQGLRFLFEEAGLTVLECVISATHTYGKAVKP